MGCSAVVMYGVVVLLINVLPLSFLLPSCNNAVVLLITYCLCPSCYHLADNAVVLLIMYLLPLSFLLPSGRQRRRTCGNLHEGPIRCLRLFQSIGLRPPYHAGKGSQEVSKSSSRGFCLEQPELGRWSLSSGDRAPLPGCLGSNPSSHFLIWDLWSRLR